MNITIRIKIMINTNQLSHNKYVTSYMPWINYHTKNMLLHIYHESVITQQICDFIYAMNHYHTTNVWLHISHESVITQQICDFTYAMKQSQAQHFWRTPDYINKETQDACTWCVMLSGPNTIEGLSRRRKPSPRRRGQRGTTMKTLTHLGQSSWYCRSTWHWVQNRQLRTQVCSWRTTSYFILTNFTNSSGWEL